MLKTVLHDEFLTSRLQIQHLQRLSWTLFDDFKDGVRNSGGKMKTKTYIRNLRQASLHLYLMNTCLKFQSAIWNIE